MTKWIALLRQPTSVVGLSTLAGTLTSWLAGATTWQTAVPLVLGAVVAILLPDNTAARTTITQATADVIQAEQAIVTVPARIK